MTNRLMYFYCSCLCVFIVVGCSKKASETTSNPTTPTPAITDFSFPANLIADSATIAGLKSDMSTDAELVSTYNAIIAEPALQALAVTPVVFSSVNSNNFSNISTQANNCKVLAVQWLFLYNTKPAEATPYFNKIRSTLMAWVNAGNTALTHLPNETAYLGFYEAYSVIRSRVSTADKKSIDQWINTRANVFRNFPARVNNWETIRLNLLYYSGYILQADAILNEAGNAYKTLLNVNLMAGGKSEDLIDRDAFAYHAYNLSFYGRILRAKAMYEGRPAMEIFKATKNNINVSLQDLIDFWKPYLTDPSNNIHLEFVRTTYEPDKQRADYNKPYLPASSLYALEELLPVFADVKSIIQTIPPGGTRYNRKLSGFIYWPR
ncbi:alginate lyase family protein [Phnomibacter sp. MR]|uniref:alginate lyase family protein n=1 Tax=Phnomibacter sp. MR TaxID=3042318 RepID=UPI003A810615